MKIKDLLLRDPSTPLVNEGIASIPETAGDAELRALKDELEMFVCEGKFEDALVRILESYIAGLANNAQKAAWVSGFYGSGKSHLLKMMTHLWADTSLPGVRARGSATLPPNVHALLRELDANAARAGCTVVAAAGTMLGGTEDVRQTVLTILLRGLGLPTDFVRAQFTLHLQAHDWLEPVRHSLETNGGIWADELADLYVSPRLAEALMAVTPRFGTTIDRVQDVLLAQFPQPVGDISADQFIDVAKGALRLRGNGEIPFTLLVLDEMQQYVGSLPDRATRLASLMEVLSQQFKSRVFVVASGQSALASQTPNIGFLDARFALRIQLQEQEVATVIRKVLLQKRPNSMPRLTEILAGHPGELSRQLADTSIRPTGNEHGDLVADYPLLPVRRRFWDACFRALDAAGSRSALRSQLRIVRDALEGLADANDTTTIGTDALYDELSTQLVNTGVLARETQEAISELDGLKRRAAAVVFLAGRLDRTNAATDLGVRTTAAHLGDLLVTDIAADTIAFRQEVATALGQMRDGGTLMLTDDEYALETTEGREWRQELERQKVALRGDVVATTRKRHDAVADAIKQVRQVVPRVPHGTEMRDIEFVYATELPTPAEKVLVWVRGEWDVPRTTFDATARTAGQDHPVVHLFVPSPAGDALDNAIIAQEAADATLRIMPVGAAQAAVDARRATDTLHRTSVARVKEIVDDLVSRSIVAQGGGTVVSGTTIADRVRDAAIRATARQFPRFSTANNAGWAMVLRNAINGGADPLRAVAHNGPTESHPVCVEVLAKVGATARGSAVRSTLKAVPFGWPQDAIDGALVALVRANVLAVMIDNRATTPDQLSQARIGTAQFRRISIVISNPQRLELRTLYQVAGVTCAPQGEDQGATDFITAARAIAAGAGGDAPLPPVPTHPAIADAQSRAGAERLQALLDSKTDLTTTITEWKGARDLATLRMPAWQSALGLEPHASQVPDLDTTVTQLHAIRTQRSLLDPGCPIDALLATLASGLREAVREAYQEVLAASEAANATLQSSAVWAQLTAAQQHEVMATAQLTAPAEPETGSPADLEMSLRTRSLDGWRSLRDALPGRAQTAIATAVRLVTPATRPVTIDRHVVLTTPADVEAWVMRQWERLSEAITRGPALVE